MTGTPSSGSKVDDATFARLNALSELASYRLDDFLGELGVSLRPAGKMLVGPCPVHGGDRADAFNLYPDGHTVRGVWSCRTRSCQHKYTRTLFGLARGVLSQQRGSELSVREAIDWLCAFLGVAWGGLRVDAADAAKRRFVAEMGRLGRDVETPDDGWDLGTVRSRLVCPSPYFLARGYSAEVLDRFSVGEPRVSDPASPMHGRAVVPVFSRGGGRVAGVTGRSLFEKCGGCQRWHSPAEDCPAEDHRHRPRYAKWRNSGFERGHTLYGLAQAAPAIRRTLTAVLVEGPGDLLRLVEGGVDNAVALLGVDLTDPQQALIEASGAMNVAVLTDADAAGQGAHAELARRLGRGFRLSFPRLDRKDLGEYTPAEIRTLVAPLLTAFPRIPKCSPT
jgi:5S rRNA maturation endonuclease (ribonuclease M5)